MMSEIRYANACVYKYVNLKSVNLNMNMHIITVDKIDISKMFKTTTDAFLLTEPVNPIHLTNVGFTELSRAFQEIFRQQ